MRIMVNRFASGQIGFEQRGNTGILAQIYTGTTANNGLWHHVVVVREGASTFRLYMDGLLLASDTSHTVGTTTVNRATVGALGRNTYSNFYNGSVDDLRVYNTAFTAADVLNWYNNP
jgi:hypothetical protein